MLSAGVVEVTEFSQISGAQFYDAPASNSVNPVTVGTVIVTPTVSLLNESFAGANAPQYGPNVPGNGAGFGSDSTGFGGATPLMLNFSEPVAAFGATFVHFENTRRGSSYRSEVSIQLFSGLDGTGTLLGRIVDSWEGVAAQQHQLRVSKAYGAIGPRSARPKFLPPTRRVAGFKWMATPFRSIRCPYRSH
jgi:hypothetical protein